MSIISRLLKAGAAKGSTTKKGGSDDVGAALRAELKQALAGDDDAAFDSALRATITHYSRVAGPAEE